MVQFSRDQLLIPKESAWFGSVDAQGNQLEWYRQGVNSTLGLARMETEGKLVFETINSTHLEMANDWDKYIAYFVNDKI